MTDMSGRRDMVHLPTGLRPNATPIGGEHFIGDVPVYSPASQSRRLNEEGDFVPGSEPSDVPNNQDTDLALRVLRSVFSYIYASAHFVTARGSCSLVVQ